MQRDVYEILLDDPQSFADQLVAFFAVELDLDLLDQLIELRVRVAAIVVLRRLRFFGQWDKLKADRSKEA